MSIVAEHVEIVPKFRWTNNMLLLETFTHTVGKFRRYRYTKHSVIRKTKTGVRSKAVVLLLLIYCFIHLSLFVGVLCWSMHWFAILTRKRELVALLQLSSVCLVTVYVLLLFLAVPWVGLQ